MPSHYLNQCRDIVNWIPRNKLQWNFNRISYIFNQENAFESVVWKWAAILSRPRCVNCKQGCVVTWLYAMYAEQCPRLFFPFLCEFSLKKIQENIPEVRFDRRVTTYNRASCEVKIILISTIVNVVITTIIMHTSAIIINVFSLKENSLEPKFREVYSFGTISRVSVYIAAMRPSYFYRRKSCNVNVAQQDFERIFWLPLTKFTRNSDW